MNQWCVAKSKPNKEAFLISNLARLGIETYSPRIIGPTVHGRQMEPLFPSYLFCSVDPNSYLWPQVRNAPGLAYFLGDGVYPVPVGQELVGHIMERVDYWNKVGFCNRFASGDRVTVDFGLFKSLDGLFVRYLPAQKRCVVLLEIMGRAAHVEIDEANLKATRRGQGQFRLQPSTISLP